MSLPKAIVHLYHILYHPHQSLENFMKQVPQRSLVLFWQLYLPLLFLFPIAVLLGPYYHITKQGPLFWSAVLKYGLYPPALIVSFLLLAAVYDRVVENAQPKLIAGWQPKHELRNIAFYYHLPVAGVGFFFFLHPWLGYFMLCFAELYSLFYSWQFITAIHGISRIRALTYWFMSLIMLYIPLFLIITINAFLGSCNNLLQILHNL